MSKKAHNGEEIGYTEESTRECSSGGGTPWSVAPKGLVSMQDNSTHLCAFCASPFNPKPCRVRQGLGRFCSRACASRWQAEQLRVWVGFARRANHHALELRRQEAAR